MNENNIRIGDYFWIDGGASIVRIVSREQFREKIWPHNHSTYFNVIGVSKDIVGEEMSMRADVFSGPVTLETALRLL